MLDQYQILTVTYQNLDTSEIARFSIAAQDEALREKLLEIKTKFEIEELSYTATCNRVTYLMYRDQEFEFGEIKALFSTINTSLDIDQYAQYIDYYRGEEAIQHYYEVASSIDSMVVGEREIFRQLRTAYEVSKEFGLTGDNLRLLDKSTVEAAKAVYQQTKIGEKPLSIVALAMEKIKEHQIDVNEKMLLVGAGATNQLVSKFLAKDGYNQVTVFNRTLDKTESICELLNAKAKALDELEQHTDGFKLLLICTGSTEAIITPKLYRAMIQEDQSKKLLVDLSVPRNVSAEVVDQFNVDYISIDELRSLAAVNLNFRKSEVIKAREILNEKLADFKKRFLGRQLERVLQNVPSEIKEIKQKALNSVFQKDIASLDEKSKLLVFEMMDYMEKKCISVPMKAAKNLIE